MPAATDLQTPPADPERTYSLEEAATIICGDPTQPNLTWLVKRLRGAAHPTLPGYKVARRWRMTQTDLDTALRILRPTPHTPTVTSMTARSRRRMAV